MSLPRPLIERFVRHLAEVAAEVALLEGRLDAPGGPADDAREPLRAIAHKLAGTAEAYGFPAVGQSARLLEASIGGEEASPTVAGHVGRMREALEAAVRGEPA